MKNKKSNLKDYYSLFSDNVLVIAILAVLSILHPILFLSIGLEVGIAYFDIKTRIDYNMNKQNKKTTYSDRVINMGTGLCITILALMPFIPYLSEIFGQTSTLNNSSLSNVIFNKLSEFINMININKNNIEDVVIPTTIITEGITLTKNLVGEIKKTNTSDKRKKLIEELKEYRDYINDKYKSDLITEEKINNESENIKRLTK